MYLSFTNVVVASTTDTLPLTIRVKGLMALQLLVCLAVQPGEARGHPGASRDGRRHGCSNARLRLATQSGRSIASALLVLVRH